jgi:chromosome segregation ATPase
MNMEETSNNYEKVREYISDFIQTTSDFEIGSFMPEFIKYSLESIKSTHPEMLLIIQSFIIDERKTIQIIEYEKMSLTLKLNEMKQEINKIENEVSSYRTKIESKNEDIVRYQELIEGKEKEIIRIKDNLEQIRLDYYQVCQKIKDLENDLIMKTQKINSLSAELHIYQNFKKKKKKCVLL